MALNPELRRVEDTHDGHPRYEVVWQGEVIGSVYGFNRTIEKDIPGKRYVAWRRKSRQRSWIADYPSDKPRNRYRYPYETRQRAVAAVLEAHLRRERAA